MRRVWDAQQPV
jgi:hypothetical protein